MKIGELEVLRDARQVLRDGAVVRISSRAFDLLQLLLDADGATVSTPEILARVWPSTVVEENNIQVHICTLRRLLGTHRDLIQTVSGRGYRMARPEPSPDVAHVQSIDPDAEADVPLDIDVSIPPLSGTLFGREQCVERVTGAISECDAGVVTLIGPAGVGKSRLAVEVARLFDMGGDLDVSYLSLAAQASTTEAYDVIGAALAPEKGTSTTPRLLVLDNCDRVSESVVRALYDSTTHRRRTRTAILLTARKPLRVSMENVITVPSLLAVAPRDGISAALEMFVSRVRSLDPKVDTTTEFLSTARHLVEQMDGLPLALELAAYHTSMLGIETVRQLLDQSVDLSNRDMRRMIDDRHASVSAALMWTWTDLGRTEQNLLAGLLDEGAEADPIRLCSIAAAAGLAPESAMELVSNLAESSFIERAFSGSSVTYRVPNTVRRFLKQQGLRGA